MAVTPVPRSTPGCQTVSEAQYRWFSETQDNGLLREASHPTVLQPLIATVAPTKGAAMLTSVALLHWLTVHTPQLQLEKWHNTYSFSWQSPGSNRSWRALQSLWNDIIHTWGTSLSTTVIWCKAFLYVKILKHQALRIIFHVEATRGLLIAKWVLIFSSDKITPACCLHIPFCVTLRATRTSCKTSILCKIAMIQAQTFDINDLYSLPINTS